MAWSCAQTFFPRSNRGRVVAGAPIPVCCWNPALHTRTCTQCASSSACGLPCRNDGLDRPFLSCMHLVNWDKKIFGWPRCQFERGSKLPRPEEAGECPKEWRRSVWVGDCSLCQPKVMCNSVTSVFLLPLLTGCCFIKMKLELPSLRRNFVCFCKRCFHFFFS